MERVVVTGLGVVSPIGIGKDNFAKALKEMKIGIDKITQFDPSDQKVKIAAQVNDFDPLNYVDKKMARRYDRFLLFALAATKEAMEDSGLNETDHWKENAAVVVASGIGGFKTLYQNFIKFYEKGPSAVSPYLIPMMIVDMVSGVISIQYGIKGPNYSTVSACASSLHSIISGTMLIRHGYVDVAIVGGSEATIDPLPIAAFANMRALSTRNDDPKGASRPFDKNRDGFVMGEGAGILILESEKHAKERGAKIYGYIEGFGMTADAYHISASEPEGLGAFNAMKKALEDANEKPESVDFVNAHATSTPVGDKSEILAIKKLLGEHSKDAYVNASKTLFGHLLGAAGAVELIGVILQMKEGFIHGMPNLEDPDEAVEGINVPKETVELKAKLALKNSFGFGGHNASIVFRIAE